MAGRKSDFTLPTNTLDELFSSQEERGEAKLSKIRDIPLEEIDDFPDHPFKVREDEDMKSAFIQTKEKAEHSVSVPESSAEEYASNRLESGIDRVSHEAVHQFDKQGRKGVQATKQNIVKAKDGIQKFKEKRAAQSLQKQAAGTVGL